jgi:hypothetical protein
MLCLYTQQSCFAFTVSNHASPPYSAILLCFHAQQSCFAAVAVHHATGSSKKKLNLFSMLPSAVLPQQAASKIN